MRGDRTLTQEALAAIGTSQQSRSLYVSPISAWELSVATRKRDAGARPNLGEEAPDRWFRAALRFSAARLAPINGQIAGEAAQVVADTGHKDPGDCFLIATARIRRMPLLTRDAIIHAIARERPGYLQVLAC